jgi:hypothetical protein
MCKPQKQGWEDKRTFADVRRAVAHEQQVRDWEKEPLKLIANFPENRLVPP